MPKDRILLKSPACQTRSKAFEMSRAIDLASPQQSKARYMRSVITVSKSAVERFFRKPYCLSVRSPSDSRWSVNFLLIKVSNILLTIGSKLMGRYLLGSERSPQFLKAGTILAHFQHSGKDDSDRHLLKSFESIGDNSGPHFLKIIAGMLSGPEAIEESRFDIAGQTEDGVI